MSRPEAQPRSRLKSRISIIGGGFSGAVTALRFARDWAVPAVIDIIDPGEMLGGGVAYSAADPAHRINVPASRMTVFAEDPTHFDRWARADGVLDRDPAALWVEDMIFPQRAVFGRYIASLVNEAARARADIHIRHHRTTAASLTARQAGFAVHLASGETLDADLVVLAVSHPPPQVPQALRPALAAGAPIIANPWSPAALDRIDPDADLLVVGTGLSMADVIASLDRTAHRGKILAISRRGLLSRGHVPGAVEKRAFFDRAEPAPTALALSQAIRAQVEQARTQGEPWQAVFDDVRAHAQRLWTALDDAERRRVVRHLRPFWDVHRFRVSPQAEAAIASRVQSGQLQTLAASLVGVEWDGTALHVRLRPRHTGRIIVARFGAIVVTTGPSHTTVIAGNPALSSLAAQGLLRADRVGLGLDVDDRHRAIGRDGAVRDDLLVAGPLSRNRVGELMGLPQVSEDAAAVARVIAESVEID